MNIINIEHLTHSFTERLLFDDVSFYLSDKDKVGVIGINGTGKSTLLKIIAGKETADRADIIMQRDLRIAYLPQIPEFADTHTTLSGALPLTEEISDQPENYIPQAKSMLHQLGFTRYDQPITELSGGQRKRIALVRTLLTPADVLILDEPTNHLDSAMAEWLEKTLRAESRPLIMITHDRYFLDSVCNRIVEVDKGAIYSYETNYSGYLERKAEREESAEASERKRQSVLRKELEWVRRGAKARTTKQKGRLQRYEELKNQKAPERDSQVEMSSVYSRMGKTTIELDHITKGYDGRTLLRDFSYIFLKGDRIGFIGANGSGKTTLMNMIAGIYYPDEGEIYVGDKAVTIRSPRDALDLGIGMIHQHFKLVDVFTAVENIALSMDKGEKFDLRRVRDKARAICEKYQFALDLDQKVYEMSVSQKQTLEIVKVLFRGADILILDEPTAVLTPQETEKLFAVMRNMKADGKAVVIITHKLHEVLSVSDRVAILRKGEYVGTVETATATESSLTEMMVGQKVELNINRTTPQDPTRRLAISHLSVRSPEGTNVLDDVSFDVYGGEILGIAGISGNGQKELLEAIAGLQHTESGSDVKFFAPGEEDKPMELLGKSPKDIRDAGVHLSFVPEDRLGMGLVGTMGMTDNMMLKSYGEGRSPLVDHRAPRELAEKIRKELGVVTPGLNTPVSRLSGGNVQKVLVGRELAASPIVLMTAYAVRGLDINTSYTIYNLLNEQKEKGVAVIYVGEDLDVLLELCDRILVLCGGKANGMLDARTTTKEEVGLRMTNLVQKEGK